MSENKNGLKGKAVGAAVLAGLGALVLAVAINAVLNLITGSAAFEKPGILTIVILVLIVGSAALSVYRNVSAGKPWYGDRKS